MLNEQEKTFCDEVVQHYCHLCASPGASLSYTPTVMLAAYHAAQSRGVIGMVGSDDQEAFFKRFIGGVMFKAEALDYIYGSITQHREKEKARTGQMRARRKAACESALEQMEVIFKAAAEIQKLTTGLDGAVTVFAKNSTEMDALKMAEHNIRNIGNH